MNPYASEDFNRVKVKSQPKKQEDPQQPGQIDHPLFEGKKMDISRQELKSFTQAMEQPEFRSLLNDYVKEISDPNNQAEYETYLRQLEDQGELPPGTTLIKPTAMFCVKTQAKRLISDINKQYFEQKAFINICGHEQIEKPKKEFVQQANGQSGHAWSLPYRVSKGRHDQDKEGNLCTTYDVVFHSDVRNFLANPDFKKFVADTAVDGVNKVNAENKEKVSSDYKIMKHLVCKGGEPGLLTIKVQIDNKLLNNYDLNKHETKLQKEITASASEHKEKQRQEEEEQHEAQQKEIAKQNNLGEIDEEDGEEEEQRPLGVVQPKYKVVHSYPVDIQSCWEGPQVPELSQDGVPLSKIPTQLTVTIQVPHIESMKEAQLDINESNLVFAYPQLYYLDLNLKYKCNQEAGKAKFEKPRKRLVITLPVVGLSEDSRKVLEENYKAFAEEQKKKEEHWKLQQQLEEETGVKIPEFTVEGEAKKVLPAVDMDGEEVGEIKDEYEVEGKTVDLQQLKKEALQEEREENARDQFLKIYKEKEGEKEEEEESLADREIRFRNEEGNGENQEGAQPKLLIQEISSNDASSQEQVAPKEEEVQPEVDTFDWDKAERLELKHQFIQQKELIFVNIPFKGYNRERDVRFGLSENELFVEVRGGQQVHRLGKTLFREVDVPQSSIQFLVDFISIKLRKFEPNANWTTLGYDISQFMVPKRGQMKSNHFKREVVPEPSQDSEKKQEQQKQVGEQESDNKENVNNQNKEAEEQEEEEIQKLLERAKGQQTTFMNLESQLMFQIY